MLLEAGEECGSGDVCVCYRSGFSEKLLEVSPVSNRANNNSKTDTLLAKDKPIRDSSKATGITDLRSQGTTAIATRDQSENI